jgi:hypothetical protein
MGYARRLSSMATQILSPGERPALRRLMREFQISHNHRNGLRRMRRMSWSRQARINLRCGSYPNQVTSTSTFFQEEI